jgi:hypothetical protein
VASPARGEQPPPAARLKRAIALVEGRLYANVVSLREPLRAKLAAMKDRRPAACL